MSASRSIIETPTRETLPLAVTGLILCGGRSLRMGRPKAFLPYNGHTLIEHRLKMMRELFQEVFLVTNQPDDYKSLCVDLVKDLIPYRGPLVGILSGLIVSQFEHAFVIACDMPLVSNRVIRQLVARRREGPIVAAARNGLLEPLLAVYSRALIPEIEDFVLSGNLKVMDFLKERGVVRVEPPESAAHGLPFLFNINTPQDYSALLLGEKPAERSLL